MEAGLDRRQRHGQVLIVRRRDDHAVWLTLSDECSIVAERTGDAVLRCQSRQALSITSADRNDFRIVIDLEVLQINEIGPIAGTDYAEANAVGHLSSHATPAKLAPHSPAHACRTQLHHVDQATGAITASTSSLELP